MAPRRASRPTSSLIALALVLSAVVLGACSNDDGDGGSATASGPGDASLPSVPKDTKATLRVAVWPEWGELKVAAEEFKKTYPNVTFKFQGITQEYFATLPQTLSSSGAPDITAIQAEAGVSPWTEIKERKLVADLTPVAQENDFDAGFPESTAANFKSSAGIFAAVPMHSVWAPVIYYNEDTLDEIGATPPAGPVATPEEWNAIITAAQDAGIMPLAAGVVDGNGASFPLGNLLQTSCGDDAYENLIYNWQEDVEPTTTWTSECAQTAIEEIGKWADDGVFGDSPATAKNAPALSLFSSGKAAMYVSGSWEAFTPTWKSDLKVGWFQAPPVPGGAEATTKFQTAVGDGLAIASNSKNVDLAMLFVNHVSAPEFQSSNAWLKAPGPSPRTDIEAPPGYSAMAKEQIGALGEVGTIEMSLTTPYAIKISPLLVELFAGQKSAQEVGEELDELNERQRRGG